MKGVYSLPCSLAKDENEFFVELISLFALKRATRKQTFSLSRDFNLTL